MKLNHQLNRVEIESFELENNIVFRYFDSVSESDRDKVLVRAIYIGVLALMEDRFSAFLAKTSNELGTELESLKMIFDMKQELFFKTAIKGAAMEVQVAESLSSFFQDRKMTDKVELTGNTAGNIEKNKTGDIVCSLGGFERGRIVIECKFDKSIRLGEVEGKDVYTKRDSAWNQLIEAQVNRSGDAAIIVFDVALVDPVVFRRFDSVGYVPEVGFIAIVDSQRGDYKNLFIAYLLARDIVINSGKHDVNFDILSILIKRIVKDVKSVLSIKSLVNNNIENCKAILKELEKGMLAMEFNATYFSRFLQNGTLTKEDLLSFYNGDEVREKFNSLERDIVDL